ncbi:LysR substrate-binding domain-containing protein [Rhodococcus sp. NPDC059234]|uniref:LysR substrate-binding domain-containing protein n=1 Tax=Rhodococcus sp. NPDC059234 TaxID=3346781 RepID=UPI00366DCF0A
MDLNFRLVRYFVTVVDTGTFTKAAELLHIATPSLSQQIRKLEESLGVVLLERDRHGARPTEAGREFLEDSRRVLAAADAALGTARRHRRGSAGVLRVGFLAGGAGELTRPIVDEFHRTAPEIDLELTQLAWGSEVPSLTSGQVDVVIARPPLDADSRLRRIVLFQEPRVLLMSRQHPLARRRRLRISDLTGVIQVDTQEGTAAWRRWWSIDPRPDGTSPTYGPMVHSIEELVQVVATSDAVAITGASVAKLFRRADVASRPLVDAEPSTVELAFLDGPVSKTTLQFISVATGLTAG